MNPASRISAVVEAFLPLSHGEAQVSGWHRWLSSVGVDVSDDSVILALRAIRKELRTLETKLKLLEVPEALYARTLTGLNDVFQTTHLHQGWGSVHAKVTSAEVRANLAWMGWTLSKFDENDIDADALAALIQAIADQEDLLRNADLLESQIEELRIALMLYRLNGVQPIVDAVNKQVGEMTNAPEELVTAVAQAGPEAQKAVSKGMDLISKAAKVAETGSKIVKFGKDLYELGASGYAAFGQLFLQGPTTGGS
jgi:hypothetical protein